MVRGGLGLMSGFLLLAAVAQLNDPDPLIWMAVYGAPFLVTVCAFINMKVMNTRWWWSFSVSVLSAVLLFTAITVSQYVYMDRLTWNLVATEEGRETVGLLIVLCWLTTLLLTSSSTRQEGVWKQSIFLVFAVVPATSWMIYKYYFQRTITLPEHCQGVI